ncbi:Spc97 / Spc98 [Perkinsus olseni]|uniref:Spindle pole body component n=1 Tax=Perkinsus olseni TaxID=32597 RepID=A0A7J6RNJ4_PEROL|nr:Spc97 / Spc98 [Perkinsus olseni]
MTAPGCVRYIEASVERARALLNGWLRGAVSPTLLEHLSAVKGLYLLGDGGFWQTFLEECAELTVARRGNVSEYDLSAGPWQLALAEHFTETSHQANLASLRLLPLGFAYASKPLFNITKQSAGAVPTIDWELACKSSLCLVGTARLGGQGAAELLRLGSSGQCWATNRQLVARGRFSTEVEFIAPESSSTSSKVRPAVPEFMYSAFPTSLGVEVRAVPTMLGSSKTTEFEVKLVLTSEGNRLPSVLAGGKSVSPGYRTTADDSFRTHTLSITNDTVKIDEVLICKFRLPSSSPIMADSRSGWKLDGLGCCFLGICSTDSANGNSYLEICKWSHTQPGSESRNSSHGSSWLDRVVVVYELPWPLPLVIGTDEFTKYSVILRSLLSLRHSALGLDTLWQTLTRLSRRQREAKALPWLTHILAVRSRMAAWLSTVIQYFTIDVISVRYAEMVKKVSLSTTDFDGIVRAHRAFLADILSKCFLESNARSRKIRLSIEKLSRACTKLAALGKQGIFDDALPNERLGKAIKSLEDKFVVGVRDLISLLDDMHLTSSERAHSLSQLLLRLDYNEVYTSPPHTSINKPSQADTIRAESYVGGDGGSSGAGGRRVHEVAAPAVSEGTTVSAVHPDNVELQHERSNHIQSSGVLSSEDYDSRRRPGTDTSVRG